MSRAWVPFERINWPDTAARGENNMPLEIAGILASADDIQVPFDFITAGNTAASLSVRVAKPCTILAVSVSAVAFTVCYLALGASVPAYNTTGGAAYGTPGRVDALPIFGISTAPGIWPYASPARPVGYEETDDNSRGIYGFDGLQRGKRKLSPGMVIYASAWAGEPGTDAPAPAHAVFRVLFGWHD